MAFGKICRINGCTNILKKQDGQVCGAHRLRFMRHGTYDISPNWTVNKKGMPHKTKNGYFRIFVDGKRVLHHRYIMEQHLGRKLLPDERVHHKNHDRTDNRIENLELCKNNSDHMRTHHHDMWKKRKTNPPLSKETITKIIERVYLPFGTYTVCFCDKKLMARNLCSGHYQWAYEHKFI